VEPELAAGLGTGAGIVLTAVIHAVAKVVRGAEPGETHGPASGATGPHEVQAGDIAIIRSHLDEIRRWTADASKESVLDAGMRTAVGQIAEALQQLVLGLDRDRVDAQRQEDRAASERSEILGCLRRLDSALQQLVSELQRRQ